MDTIRLEVELPEELATYVREVAEGNQTSLSEVVSQALRRKQDEDDWMRRMVAEADADPSPTFSAEEVSEALRNWDGKSLLD